MKRKLCSYCKQYKPLSEFWKDSSRKDGYSNKCKVCDTMINLNYRQKNKEKIKEVNKLWRDNHKEKLKTYRLILKEKTPYKLTWYRINSRCNSSKNSDYDLYGGRGIKNLLSQDNVKFLWFRDKAYEMKQPSIDRIDSNGHYCIENCRFIEMKENISRANAEHKTKSILQYDKEGNFIREWDSIKEASDYHKIKPTTIGNCLGKRVKSSGGYIWKYKI